MQLQLGGSGRDWVLWPVASVDDDLEDFADGLVRDLGVPLQLRRGIVESVRQQVADWVANVPPPASGPEPRRELIRWVLQLVGWW